MMLVGLFLAAIGVAVLQVSGGAARDTSIVVSIAAFAVTDLWGAGATWSLTRRQREHVVGAWISARLAWCLLVGALFSGVWLLVVGQLVVAGPAAWAGVRLAMTQAQISDRERARSARGRRGVAAS